MEQQPIRTEPEDTRQDYKVLGESLEPLSNLGSESRRSAKIDQNSPIFDEINDLSGLLITGFDVSALYPSLRDVDVACLIRESIIHSELDFDGFDLRRALCYLRIVAGDEIMKLAGLGNLIPKWQGDRVESLRVSGSSGKDMNRWTHANIEPTIFQKKLIISLLIEVGVLVLMGSHCYEFAGSFYLQTLGGPIGLAATAWIASLTMKCFDNLWNALLVRNRVIFHLYLRYVDDSRTFLRGLRKGVRWAKNRFVYSKIHELEDIAKNEENDVRNVNLLLQAMNSIMDFLSFTGEAPSEFPKNRLPTLDCSIFTSEGQILHTFYEKPMRSDRCLNAKTALSEISVKSSLRQEIIRRLINTDLRLHIDEKIAILDSFYVKLRKSGHSHEYIRLLFVEALLKFQQMVKCSNLEKSNPAYKPLYLSNDYDKINRGIQKFLKRYNWYDPSTSMSRNDWKRDIPPCLRPPPPKRAI